MNQISLPIDMPNEIIKVGDIKEYIVTKNLDTSRKKKTAVFYQYTHVQYDREGWASCDKYLPGDYDLVHMRLKREKTIPGWICGKTWYGLRLKADDTVIFWKKKDEEKCA